MADEAINWRHRSYVRAWMAPTFLTGVLVAGCGAVYRYGEHTADARNITVEMERMRLDVGSRRLEDMTRLENESAELRSEIAELRTANAQRLQSEDETRRRLEQAQSDMGTRIQKFDDQMQFLARTKPGWAR